MATYEAYMLDRNQEESKRLDAQHGFLHQLANGTLLQPSIFREGCSRTDTCVCVAFSPNNDFTNREPHKYAVGQSDAVILSFYPGGIDTFSTVDHPSPLVQAEKTLKIIAPSVQLLQAGICRRGMRAEQAQISSLEAKELKEDLQALRQWFDVWNQGTDPACNNWDYAMTSIVARKALVVTEHHAWMTAIY